MKAIRPELLTGGAELKIAQTPGVEPEAQAAVREIAAKVPVGPRDLSTGTHGATVGRIPGIIQYGTTAGAIADAVKTACVGCAHWNQRGFLKWVAVGEGPLATAEHKQDVAAIKARITTAGADNSDPAWAEKSIATFGVCEVLSEWVKGALKAENPMFWPVITDRDATCPEKCHAGQFSYNVCTPEQPLGLFKPRDLDAKKIGNSRRDQVLFDASGKGKRP